MDLSRIDLNLLVALDALLTERHVSRAAARVGLSQPGMSSALARLRRLTGDPLLIREGPVLVPTARAEALAQPVREALAIVERALEDRPAFDPASDECTIRVSCSDYSAVLLIAPLMRRLTAEAPGVTIQIQPRSADPVRSLRRAETDLVIEPVAVMGEAPLPSRHLFEDRWLCCAWSGNPHLAGGLSAETFAGLGHIVYSMGRGTPMSLADDFLVRSGLRRRVEFSVESFFLAPLLLQGTELVALVLARVVPLLQRMADITVVPPPLPIPPIAQTMWWSPAHTSDPAHRWVRERIAAVADELATSADPGA